MNEQWRKSRKSDNTGGACVEVADLAAAVAVRDSKDLAMPPAYAHTTGPSTHQTAITQ